MANGHNIITAAICDYEVRRELIRSGRTISVAHLDALLLRLDVMPINNGTMLRAAQLWADARNRGMPTADRFALDADVILAAQAQLLAEETAVPVVVATTNARHLTQFVDARGWQQITH
jgi:predicted nucleic acid-binding protein